MSQPAYAIVNYQHRDDIHAFLMSRGLHPARVESDRLVYPYPGDDSETAAQQAVKDKWPATVFVTETV